MNNIKSSFSIKDLENLTGIKAHTIRIWEKRYNLLEPERTDTNIRTYSLDNLQKLLNISYLNKHGYKISKIALMDKNNLSETVKETALETNVQGHAINSFKLAMLNFDQELFQNTYSSLAQEKTFRSIFYDVFIPLLSEIGLLWQTDTITPAHEHFLTTLIRQKIVLNTELIQSTKLNDSSKTFVLYLPDNEIHELGLMFIHYELISKGHQSIFLGRSVPIDCLKDILSFYNKVVFISYFTIKPETENIQNYFKEFSDKILLYSNSKFWVLGKALENFESKNLPNNITTFSSIANLVKEI